MRKKEQISIKQQRLAQLYAGGIADEGEPMSQEEMLVTAGYSPTSKAIFRTEGFRNALINEMERVGLTKKTAASRLKWLVNGGEDGTNANATAAGIREYLKIVGAYAPTKSEKKIDKTVMEGIESDDGDYFKFLKKRNKTKIIEGKVL